MTAKYDFDTPIPRHTVTSLFKCAGY